MLGIMNDDEFEKELSKSSELNPSSEPIVEIKDRELGKGVGNNDVPNSLRRVIGEEAVVNGRQAALELGSMFGIKHDSVGAYRNGSTSCATYDKQPNLSHLNSARLRISKRATEVLGKALDEITDENRLSACSAIELASVAKSMSGIVKDMEPELPKSGSGEQQNTFIFYSPQIKTEEHYDVVNARD